MANRFWVDGAVDDDWEGTDNWSTTTGGGGGSAIPTASDDVRFDGASGHDCKLNGPTIKLAKTLDFTGYTGTLTFDEYINISGNVTFASGLTVTIGLLESTSPPFHMIATGVIDKGGLDPIPFDFAFGNTTGTYTSAGNADVTFTGKVYTHWQSSTATVTINGFKIICKGGCQIGGNGTGDTVGTATIEIDGTQELKFATNAYNYACSLDIEVIAGTCTVRGFDVGGLEEVHLGVMTFLVSATGVSNWSNIDELSNEGVDGTTLNLKAENLTTPLIDQPSTSYFTWAGTGTWTITKAICNTTIVWTNNGPTDIFVDEMTATSGALNWSFLGTRGFTFKKYGLVGSNGSSYTQTFKDGNTYTFKEQFIHQFSSSSTGVSFVSSSGSFRAIWVMWHACRVEIERGVTVTRITNKGPQMIYMSRGYV